MDHPSVALVTMRRGAGFVDHEDLDAALAEAGDALLEAALADRGAVTATVAWDDPEVDWGGFDLAVLRSPWDYTERLEEFLRWVDRVGEATELHNPPGVVRANVHKRYLLDLAAAGVPVVPTALVDRAGARSGWAPEGRIVVKPAVGAGARGASTHPSWRAARDAVAELRRRGEVLVQPFVPSVTARGEVSLVWVDGELAQAVRKVAADGEYRVQPQFGGTMVDHEPTADEVAVARAALGWAARRLLYARVDLVEIDGRAHVMELELVEPSLFLRRAPGVAELLADAVLARATGGPG